MLPREKIATRGEVTLPARGGSHKLKRKYPNPGHVRLNSDVTGHFVDLLDS